MKYLRRLLCMLLILSALLPLGSLAQMKANAAEQDGITSVLLSPDRTTLRVQVILSQESEAMQQEKLLYLFALSPAQLTKPLDQLTPCATERSAQSLTFELSVSGNYADRLYARYQLAFKDGEEYITIGSGKYLDNPSEYSLNTQPIPAVQSKKGLQASLYSDAQLLGVSHTVIALSINDLFSATPTDYSFTYLGKTVYLDRTQMETLDYKISRATQAGIRVYLNPVLTRTDNESLSHLYYSKENETAQFYAYQIENEDAAHDLQGLISYLTSRYTRADQTYGFVCGYIVGYEVNSNRYRNYRGDTSLDAYAASYARLVRTVATASRLVYAQMRTYISIANNWTVDCIDPTTTASPLLDYSAYDFLTAFRTAMARQGDAIDWSVAINPYPSDVTLTQFWKDTNATDSIDTPYLTMKNLQVLTELLASEDYQFASSPRTVLVSEFGVSGKLGTESENTQAAAVIYAYYKALSLPTVEAMIWHRQVDRIGENDLYYGLWSSDYSAIVSPESKKKSYQAMRYLDLDRASLAEQEDMSAFALSIIGVSSWQDLIPNWSDEILTVGTLYESIPLTASPSTQNREIKVFSFDQGEFFGFSPSDSARYLQILTDEEEGELLYASLYPTSHYEYAGISTSDQSLISLQDQAYLKLRLKASHGNPDESISVMLRITGQDKNGNPCIFEGASSISADSFSTLTFHIEDFAQQAVKIRDLRIWVKGVDGKAEHQENGEYSLSLQSITLISASRFSWLGVLAVVLGTLAAVSLVVVGWFVLRAQINKKHRSLRRAQHRIASESHRYKIKKK